MGEPQNGYTAIVGCHGYLFFYRSASWFALPRDDVSHGVELRALHCR
jgi:hypothetical protein